MAMIANDVLNAVCYRVLIEPVVNTTLGTAVPGPGSYTVDPPSLVAIYVGALLVVGIGATQEVVTVSAVVTGSNFTATFLYAHPSTDPVVAATFPTGQPNDILFTQTEMLGYLSDALMDFTLKTWPIYNIVQSQFSTGVRAYTTPSDAIRIERISRQNTPRIATNLGTTVTGSPNLQTVTPGSMYAIVNGTQLIVGVNGVNQEIVVAANVTATTFQAIFLLNHAASDPVLDDAPAIYRLWDVSVTNLDQLDPNWQATEGFPRMYYEDELNVGQYGVYPSPAVTFPSNIWYSQRPPVTLALNSSVFVPDPLAYIPYYGMLARIFRKDGELRDPQRESYCQKRYDMGVEIVVRFLEGLQGNVSPGPVQPPPGGTGAGA